MGRNPASSVNMPGSARRESGQRRRKDGTARSWQELTRAHQRQTPALPAFVGGFAGLPLTIINAETMSLERRKLLAAYGAQLELTEGRLA